ncbi:MAG: acyl-[acyl-carrier-protein]--UDP-N-acetylglucosamine O-acyltransferase [Candidatus Poribacteria bacterium]|nr:MAG: acyl-[acyl-carrier-protein]--UDP-N-acetylglucosamine O-acyltransferase [Candidatus Poribacteria bacterium]
MTRIDPTARIGKNVVLGEGVEIGPFTVIEDDVIIGDNTKIEGHVKIGRYTQIGRDCVIHWGAVLGHTSVDLKAQPGVCRTIIGDRNIIREYVSISASSFDGQATRIGNDNLLMHWTNIAHDCVIGDRVIMANFATLGGHVVIEGNARIGAHAAFHQHVRVGEGVMAGACSKFVQDVPPYTVADGHPARVRGLNLIGRGTARNHPMAEVPEESIRRLKQAFRLLFRSNLNTRQAIEQIRRELLPDRYVAHLIEFIESSKRGICR